jgi:hypothetical protein
MNQKKANIDNDSVNRNSRDQQRDNLRPDVDVGTSSSSPAVHVLEVIAPCDMDEGFTFLTRTSDGDDVPVTVPPGGVRSGQVFYCQRASASPSPITVVVGNPSQNSIGSSSHNKNSNNSLRKAGSWMNLKQENHPHHAPTNIQPHESIPLLPKRKKQLSPTFGVTRGTWHDHLWDCCRFGPCHTHIWQAMCCPQLLAAHIMARLQLNWRGIPGQTGGYNPWTVWIWVGIVVLFWGLFLWTAPFFDLDRGNQPGVVWTAIYNVITVSFLLISVALVTKLRHYIREQNQIPTTISCCQSSCGGKVLDCEDCCLAVFCHCCTVAQMARHTMSYDDSSV